MSCSRQPGFTLIELLVAVALFGAMVVGLSAFYGMVFGDQYRKFADLAVANGTTSVRRAFDSAVGSATYIQAPLVGNVGNYLTVWTNLDTDGATALVTGVTPQFSHLCCTPDVRCTTIYLYQGTGSANVPSACGANPASGVTRMLLVGGSGFSDTSLAFNRLEPNLVQMTSGITLTDTRMLEHSAFVETQAVVSANDQN